MLNLRLAYFDHLVDLRRVDEIRGIEHRDGAVWVGAGTTQVTVESTPEVASSVPLLARATPLIGHFQIRNRGTVGGSLAHADPAAEYPAVALTLDAEFDACSPRGHRTVPASEFFTSTWTTALADDEVLTGISFPTWSGRCGFAIDEVARRHGDFAIAGATVAVEIGDDDRVRRCCIGLLGLGSTPERGRAAESAVAGVAVHDIEAVDVGRLAVAELDSVPSDLHGSAAYRSRVGAHTVTRAWQRAVEEATR
jgi:carbon-monoxide dehydrogenase medium subunit